jgi:hypothetical protein
VTPAALFDRLLHNEAEDGGLIQIIGSPVGGCVTLSIEHRSRVGFVGRNVGTIFAQVGVPWVARRIQYKICCNGDFEIKYSGTKFPSHMAYLSGSSLGFSEQSGLAQFMFTGDGNVAPMGKIFTVTGSVK